MFSNSSQHAFPKSSLSEKGVRDCAEIKARVGGSMEIVACSSIVESTNSGIAGLFSSSES